MTTEQNTILRGRKVSINGPNTRYFVVIHNDTDAEACNRHDDASCSCIFGYANCCVFNFPLFHRKNKRVNRAVISKNRHISIGFHVF